MDKVKQGLGGVVGGADLVKDEVEDNPDGDGGGRAPDVGDGLLDVVMDDDGAPSREFDGVNAALDEGGLEVEAASGGL